MILLRAMCTPWRGRFVVQIVAGSSCALGLIALMGWWFDLEGLKCVVPGSTPLKPNVAAGFLLCGVALWSLALKRITKSIEILATALALTVLCLGGLTLAEHFFEWNVGIENWPTRQFPASMGAINPARMMPTTAFCFVLMGMALFAETGLIRARLRYPLVAGLSAALAFIGILALGGFLLEKVFGPQWNLLGMSISGVTAAVGFMLLGAGLVALLQVEGRLAWSLDFLTTTGFAFGVLLTVLTASSAFTFAKQMLETNNAVTHRQEVLKKIEEVTTDMLDLASRERLYIITGNEDFLTGRDQMKTEVRNGFQKVRQLTADNPSQQKNLDDLEAFIAQRIDWEDQMVAVRRVDGFSAVARLIATGPGIKLSKDTRSLLTRTQEEEYRLLGGDRQRAQMASTATFLLLPLGVFVSIAVLSLGMFFLNAGVNEQQQAENALRVSEAQLQTIVENLDEGLVVSDLNGRLLQWNRAALKLHGYSSSEQDRRVFTDLIDTFQLLTLEGAIVPVERWPLARVLAGEHLHDLELRVHRVGSDVHRILNYGGTLVHDAMGHPLMAMITITDITQRKEAEEMVRASEERYRTLFESNPNPMWVYDLETLSFLAVNSAAVAHYGYSSAEFLAMTIKDIRPAEDIPSLIDNVDQTTNALGSSTYWRHRKKNGTVIDVEITSHELSWLGHHARVVLVKDITERKRAEERLKEQADMLDRAHDAIIVRNFNDRRIVFWNTGAERLYGWSASEAIGQPVDQLILANPGELGAISMELLSTGEFRGELKEITKDKKELTVEVWSTLILNSDGTPRSVLSINNDITEQKKLEAQLLRAQRLESIGTLASGVAHDLNNILTPILICSQALRSELGEEDRQSAISLIEGSAHRGAGIVKQVLTFARGVQGERVLIKPSYLIEEIVDIARKTFPKSIEIIGRYPDDLWSIEGDPTQLHQVLLNLSVNARDAMPNGGSLVVWAENFIVDEHYASMTPEARAGQFVALRVSDTGSGMPRAMIDKIFDPFFTTKEVGKGTGLGLSTVLGIVKSHGGFISVYSEQGKGTTFKLFMPATVTREELQQSKSSVVPIQGNGELILVVDDEPNILGVTKMILEKHRYDVLSAHDGTEALAIFAQQMQSIRLVLTDISMPYMDGAALARALRKMKSDLPIIASTGQGEQAGLADFAALGVTNILAKPYNTEQLLTAVHDTLQEKSGPIV